MRRLVVIPTYNERSAIKPLIQEIRLRTGADVLIVDDASPDNTAAIVEELRARDNHVHVLARSGKYGLGSAYRDGFRWALARDFEVIVQMDGDGSHKTEYLDALLAASRDVDLVVGSRYAPGGSVQEWSWFRRSLSRAANLYTGVLLGLRDARYRVTDSTSGFKCWHSALLGQIDFAHITSDGYAFQIEMTWAAVQRGARIREVPISFLDRTHGKSKLSIPHYIKEALLLPFQLKKL